MSLMSSRRYTLLGRIAAGGMGTVFIAVKRGQRAPLYALKITHTHLASEPAFRKTMAREARAAASVVHPNVVRVVDVVEDAGELELVMEYVDGVSLSDLLAAGTRLPADVVTRIVLDIAEGLEAVHGRGLIHRDVSPQNILVGVDGVAKLADFGLAKSASGHESSTTEGTVKGKLGYVAPEYVRGRAIDARVDTFALGVVFWEALLGERLFRGSSDAETLEHVLRAEPRPLGRTDADLAAFDPIVARMLAKDPLARPSSVHEARLAIAEAASSTRGGVASRERVAEVVRGVAGASLAARHADVERAVRRVRLRRGAPIVASVLVVVTAVAAGVAIARSRTPDHMPAASQTARVIEAQLPSASIPSSTETPPTIEIDGIATRPGSTGRVVLPRAHSSAAASSTPSSSSKRPPPNPY